MTAPIAAPDLTVPTRIHIVGVGGAGMSAIATVFAAMGHTVSGSDLKSSAGIDRLRSVGVQVTVGHAAENVPAGVAALAVSTAIPPTNVEVQEAQRRGVPVLRRAEALAAICATRRPIAVAGTHGKTTTSSMLALVMVEAGLRPSFIVGGELNEIGTGAAWSDGEWFVVEADESDGTFLELGAEVAVVTSVEPDHLEHWGGWEPLRDAFARFVSEARGVRLVCADDPAAAAIGAATGARTYGTAATADYHMADVVDGREGVAFTIRRDGGELGRIELPVPGLHNARNACAAVATAMEVGAAFEPAARALRRYAGVARRFQFRGEAGGVTFIDDYAHLPTEVRSALEAAKAGAWERVVCVFQPHRYSRTAALARDFAEAFDDADVLVVTEIDGHGEQPRPGVSGKLVLEAVLDARPGRKAYWFPGRATLSAHLRTVLRPGDLCLTLGAGNLTLLPGELLSDLAR